MRRQPRLQIKPDDGRYFSYGTSMFKKLRNARRPRARRGSEHGVIAQFDGEPRFRQRLLTLPQTPAILTTSLRRHSRPANVRTGRSNPNCGSRIANCVV